MDYCYFVLVGHHPNSHPKTYLRAFRSVLNAPYPFGGMSVYLNQRNPLKSKEKEKGGLEGGRVS